MAIDLDTIAKAPSELKTLGISPIINRSDLREWMAVIAGENWFFEEDYLTAAMVDSGLTMYIGRWEGKAISVAMLFVNAGVAGIYLVNVLSNYWRRGVGRAMTHRLLTDARDLGCSTAVLQASDMGRSLYEKMGFCQICEIEYYSWHNITFNQFMEA
jgi:GNAT superfamily N-acetyltransferase